ncbi:hypothetical protein [Micromonospora sp. NPDC023956]|uniref:hypothetical protein n=1 Tax=Micromonospora sp. NPDC023956 TaxID=3155722 RepID=UPI0033DF7AE7
MSMIARWVRHAIVAAGLTGGAILTLSALDSDPAQAADRPPLPAIVDRVERTVDRVLPDRPDRDRPPLKLPRPDGPAVCEEPPADRPPPRTLRPAKPPRPARPAPPARDEQPEPKPTEPAAPAPTTPAEPDPRPEPVGPEPEPEPADETPVEPVNPDPAPEPSRPPRDPILDLPPLDLPPIVVDIPALPVPPIVIDIPALPALPVPPVVDLPVLPPAAGPSQPPAATPPATPAPVTPAPVTPTPDDMPTPAPTPAPVQPTPAPVPVAPAAVPVDVAHPTAGPSGRARTDRAGVEHRAGHQDHAEPAVEPCERRAARPAPTPHNPPAPRDTARRRGGCPDPHQHDWVDSQRPPALKPSSYSAEQLIARTLGATSYPAAGRIDVGGSIGHLTPVPTPGIDPRPA